MRKILFVFNPNSGKGLIKSKLYEVVDTLVKGGFEVCVYPTQAAMDGYNRIVNMEENYDMIVCSGGDGTLNEVVSAIRKMKSDIPVGYIPSGSTNDFAASVGISKTMKTAAQQIVDGTPKPVDIGSINGKTFNYVAAFGAFTEVSYATSQELKNVIGHSAYVVEAIKRLTNLRSYRMTLHLDDEVIKDDFIYGMISNSRYIAGRKNLAGKNVKMNDGLFEVSFIRQPKNPFMLEQTFSGLIMNNITD
ncbi:MAG: diacylglycerol/lipid kinase family protein, partial [Lachnospiraceae bacterium]